MLLQNKTILITGGGAGIGFAMAKALVAKGNQVLICGRDRKKLEDTTNSLDGVKAYACDVSDPQECSKLYQSIKSDGYTVNVLINNAAILGFHDFSKNEICMTAVRKEISTNLLGPMELVNLFLPDLMQQRDSMIINVGSPAGRCPMSLIPVYSASKAALDYYTKVLRWQLKGKVKVVEIFPPTVNTEMTTKIEGSITSKMQPDAFALAFIRQVERGKSEIWIGIESYLFKAMDLLLHPFMFLIINKIKN